MKAGVRSAPAPRDDEARRLRGPPRARRKGSRSAPLLSARAGPPSVASVTELRTPVHQKAYNGEMCRRCNTFWHTCSTFCAHLRRADFSTTLEMTKTRAARPVADGTDAVQKEGGLRGSGSPSSVKRRSLRMRQSAPRSKVREHHSRSSGRQGRPDSPLR